MEEGPVFALDLASVNATYQGGQDVRSFRRHESDQDVLGRVCSFSHLASRIMLDKDEHAQLRLR